MPAGLWTVVGARMKGARLHRVPLSDSAMAILRADNGWLQGAGRPSAASPRFRGQQTEAAISVAVLNRMLAAGRQASVRCQGIVT
jgi:integrase